MWNTSIIIIKKSNETDDNYMLSVIQKEEISLFSASSKWEHLSGFEDMISDSSDNDSSHRNFGKPFIYFCHILQFGKTKWIEEEWSNNISLIDLTFSHLLDFPYIIKT